MENVDTSINTAYAPQAVDKRGLWFVTKQPSIPRIYIHIGQAHNA